MKQKLFIIALSCIFMITSCYHEDDITPSDNYSVLRFEFPQGNNPWDAEIKEIHDIYGVYLLYKDITPQDLNRQWTSLGTGKLYYGNDLNDEQAPYYLNFVKNHIFNYVTPEIAQLVLPAKIYMLDNLRGLQPGEDPNGSGSGTGGTGTGGTGTGGTGTGGTGTGGTGTGGTGTGGTGTGGTGTGGTGTGGTGTGGTGTGGTGTGGTGTGGTNPNFVALKTDGFDYWAISFTDNEISNPNTQSLKIRRATFLYLMIEAALLNGTFIEPSEFSSGIDYTKTEIVYQDYQKDDPNYYMNRGFINIIKRGFSTGEQIPKNLGYYTNPSWEQQAYPYRDFLSYIRAAMFYTREEFQAKYSPETYPLINQRYEIVVHHLKNNCGIDLEGIAKGPQD